MLLLGLLLLGRLESLENFLNQIVYCIIQQRQTQSQAEVN